MPQFYVTYAYASHQRNNYSVVQAPDMTAAYEIVEQRCGSRYAFLYTEEGFQGQALEHGLTEIPLQPQIMRY